MVARGWNELVRAELNLTSADRCVDAALQACRVAEFELNANCNDSIVQPYHFSSHWHHLRRPNLWCTGHGFEKPMSGGRAWTRVQPPCSVTAALFHSNDAYRQARACIRVRCYWPMVVVLSLLPDKALQNTFRLSWMLHTVLINFRWVCVLFDLSDTLF